MANETTIDLLRTIAQHPDLIDKYPFFEFRYHGRYRLDLTRARKEGRERTDLSNGVQEGISVRIVSSNGAAMGSAATCDLSINGLKKAIRNALKGSRVGKSSGKGIPLAGIPAFSGVFKSPVKKPVKNVTLENKKNDIKEIAKLLDDVPNVKSSDLNYSEILDNKAILTSDGIDLELHDSKVTLSLNLTCRINGKADSISESIGRTGGYEVMDWSNIEELTGTVIERGNRLPKAKKPPAGKHVVILEPQLVRLLGHEALGHPSEADIVKNGSVLTGKIDQQILHESITIHDDPSLVGDFGFLPGYDDEGTPAKRTTVFDKGVLRSYLHSRSTAKEFGVTPTGNARAFVFTDDPLVRMTNTVVAAGDITLNEMIEDTKEGYLLLGRKMGMADSNSEFMFGVGEGLRINSGEIRGFIKQVTISGLALDVLNADLAGVSKETATGYAGYCGKGQTAFTGGGGAYIKTRVTMGGEKN